MERNGLYVRKLVRISRVLYRAIAGNFLVHAGKGGEKLGLEALDTNYEISVTLKSGSALQAVGVKADKKCDENGEILDELMKVKLARAERFALQSVAREILPGERVARCLRFRIPEHEVEVWRHLETRRSFYAGLAVCGSVWTCPCCSAKISERRRKELKQAIGQHTDQGGHVAMLTLTVRHSWTDDLNDMLVRLAKAMDRFRSGKRYNSLRERIGLIGTVRAFELTHGKNGWHPHFHVVIFYRNRQDLRKLEREFFELWKLACKSAGLETLKDAFSLQDAQEADDYVSKWGIESEMTKFHSKRGGREKGRTPFDILRDYLADPSDRDAHLFRVYAAAFKGKQQLVWSRGLKHMFQIEELDDESIAKKKEEKASILGVVPYHVWRVALKKRDLRNSLLELTEDMPFELAIQEFRKIVNSL